MNYVTLRSVHIDEFQPIETRNCSSFARIRNN